MPTAIEQRSVMSLATLLKLAALSLVVVVVTIWSIEKTCACGREIARWRHFTMRYEPSIERFAHDLGFDLKFPPPVAQLPN